MLGGLSPGKEDIVTDMHAVAAQLTEAFNSHSPAVVGRLYSADQVTLLPGLPQPVAGKNTPIPFKVPLERAAAPQKTDITSAVRKVLHL